MGQNGIPSERFQATTCVTNSVTRVGDFLHFGQLLKVFATMNLPKSPTFLGNFSKGAKIIDFSNEIIFGQLL